MSRGRVFPRAVVIVMAAIPLLLAGCASAPQEPEPQAKPVETMPDGPPVPSRNETVMQGGQTIVATTPSGTIRIEAGSGLYRQYTWDGGTRGVVMNPREERWAGSLGIHYHAEQDHWEPHNGIARARVEEGQRHFETMDDAKIWMRIRRLHFVHSDDGLVVGWRRLPDKGALQVEVWQFYIDGEKPTQMAGARNDRIQVLNKKPVDVARNGD